MTFVKSPTTTIRVSGKQLGAFALDDMCDRCMWLKLRMRNRMPFSVFPGIFSSIDAWTKNIVHAYFDRHGGPPAWLEPLGKLVGYIEPPHWSKFQMHDVDHDILLTGAADGIYVRDDGTLVVVDYKTARYTAGQDALLPVYTVQLAVYRLIAEHIGLGAVSSLALIYTEPVTDAADYDDGDIADALALQFTPRIVPVELQPETVSTLLERVRALHDLSAPPAAQPDCRNCALVDELVRHVR